MGVIARRIEINWSLDPKTGKIDKNITKLIRNWALTNQVEHGSCRVFEEIQWDLAPMRNFFHGVIVPAFVAKFNETMQSRRGMFLRAGVKEFLKAKVLGFKRDDRYKYWNRMLRLDGRPADISDWEIIDALFTQIKDPPELNGTSELNAERYWRFLNDCEHYYFSLFHDMYDIRSKPVNPDIERN